jgi:hypothetical protein
VEEDDEGQPGRSAARISQHPSGGGEPRAADRVAAADGDALVRGSAATLLVRRPRGLRRFRALPQANSRQCTM